MSPEHLRVEIEALADHARQRLQEQGYTANEIDRAASGLIDGNRLQPTHDGEHVHPAWLYVETLACLGRARRALRDGDIEAARRHYEEAERNEIAAQRETAGARTSARNAANASNTRKRELSEIIDGLAKRPGSSGELWSDLWSELNRYGMDPEERVTPGHSRQYAYIDEQGRTQTISEGRFATRLSKARQ